MYKYLYRSMLTLFFTLMTLLTGVVIYLLGFVLIYSAPIHLYFSGKREFGLYDIIFWTILVLVSIFTSLSFTVTAGRNYLLYDLKFCELLKQKTTK